MADIADGPEAGDLFDSLYSMEQDIMDKGFDTGESQGRSSGIQEGWELGLQKGAELGGDLGYIEGLLLAWNLQGLIKTERHRKLAESIQTLIDNFPHDDPRDESLLDVQQKAKAKFKVLSSQLNKGAALKQSQPEGISF